MYLPYSRLLQVPDEEREFLTLDELKPHQLTELGIPNQICNSTADTLLIASSQQHSHHHLQHLSPSNTQQINNHHQQQPSLIINNNNTNNNNIINNNNNINNNININSNNINTINNNNNTNGINNLQHPAHIHNLQPRQTILQSQSQQIYDVPSAGSHIFYDLNVQSNSDDSNSMYMNAGGLTHSSHNNVEPSINVGNGITSGSGSGGNNINITMDGGGQLNSQHSQQNLINSPSCRKRKNFYIDGSDFEDDTGDDAKSVKTIDENKKQNHSEIEKRRRDKMNTYITELSAMVPMCHAMSRKLDKLTVLRMAVQHLKTIRGAVHSYTEGQYKPDFLSDQELKMLILQAAEGFLFVVGCDRGRILFVSESVSQILNYSQGDLLGQSWFDILHPKDVAKVKEQLSSSDLSPRERLIDAKTMLPVKTDIPQGLTRLCPGARRSFFCRMKYKTIGSTQIKGENDVNHTVVSPPASNSTTPSTIAGVSSSISSCSARRKKQINSDKKYCVVQCTGYLKSWAPAKMGIDDNENDVDGSDSCNLSCLVAVGRIPPNIYTLTNNIKSISVTADANANKSTTNTNDDGTSSSTINSNSLATTTQSQLRTDTITADSSTSATNNNTNNLSTKESSSLASSSTSTKSISFTSLLNVNGMGSTTNNNYIQPITRTIQFISRHTMDGKFLFVDQRATLVLGFLPQELLGTSMYEYYQHSDIPTLAESHVAVLQSSDKITTNIYRFRTKDNGYVHLQSEWKAFKNPWTKEVEYLIAKNSVIFDCRAVNSINNHIPKSEHVNENQPPGNFAFFNQASPKDQIHKLINTHVETSKIGRQIAEQVLDYQRRISESSTESSPDPDTISGHSNGTHYLPNNGNSTIPVGSGMDMSSDNASPFPSAANQQGNNGTLTEYNNQLRSTLVQSPDQDSDSEIIRLMGSSTIPETSNNATTTDGNDDAAMAVIMSLLEADGGLGGPVDFTGLPWPLP